MGFDLSFFSPHPGAIGGQALILLFSYAVMDGPFFIAVFIRFVAFAMPDGCFLPSSGLSTIFPVFLPLSPAYRAQSACLSRAGLSIVARSGFFGFFLPPTDPS